MRSRPMANGAAPANGTVVANPLDSTLPTLAAPDNDGPYILPEPGAAQPMPAYPYPLPPGYPYDAPPAYPLPPGYPPGAYAPPPGYPYPAPAMGYPYQASPQPQPSPAHNEFPTAADVTVPSGARAYRRRRGANKLILVAVCLLLTGGLIGGGIFFINRTAEKKNKEDQADNSGKTDGKSDGKTDGKTESGGPVAQKTGPYPRRLLYINITKYMYLNPLTSVRDGPGQLRSGASRIAFDWRIPTDKENNQVYILSDTAPDGLIPVKDVVTRMYERFFETSRDQDRIVVYFGGHAFEKDGISYLAPIEGEIDGEGWQNTLIPLKEFYDKLSACKATQKVMIWDVCRFNPQRGIQRPGSGPMSPALHKALASPPPGVEAIVTCSPGENALEFTNFQPDPVNKINTYTGSAFIESVRYVGEKTKTARIVTPSDPLPVAEWAQAVGARVAEMAALVKEGPKQTLKREGMPRADRVAFKPEEPPAKRFEMPVPPKGIASSEIKAIEREFFVVPIKSDLIDAGLSELPYLDSVMKDYKADVPLEDILKDKERYKLRAVTLAAFDTIREVWGAAPGAGGLGNLKEELDAPITESIKKEINRGLEVYAIGIAKLELIDLELDNAASLKQSETKRWQAHYEYARAVVKTRLAYLNEYNKLMGDVRTETLPALDKALGQDSYKLVSSEKMKSKKDVQKLADDAQEAYARLINEHRGTPWALQAKRDRSFSLGLAWQPFVSGRGSKP